MFVYVNNRHVCVVVVGTSIVFYMLQQRVCIVYVYRTCVHTYTCMYTHTPVCTHMHMYVHTYTCMYTHTPVCTHIHLYVHTYTCMYTHTPVCTHIHMFVDAMCSSSTSINEFRVYHGAHKFMSAS
eukprot:GHVQ01008503.1.p1 GENE.GHVQ01008503.1~~GHVQ01008503.1.p1  ORF type:complete len:125 (-),score=15.76 GHVQ01008503.1:257-631(-)